MSEQACLGSHQVAVRPHGMSSLRARAMDRYLFHRVPCEFMMAHGVGVVIFCQPKEESYRCVRCPSGMLRHEIVFPAPGAYTQNINRQIGLFRSPVHPLVRKRLLLISSGLLLLLWRMHTGFNPGCRRILLMRHHHQRPLEHRSTKYYGYVRSYSILKEPSRGVASHGGSKRYGAVKKNVVLLSI